MYESPIARQGQMLTGKLRQAGRGLCTAYQTPGYNPPGTAQDGRLGQVWAAVCRCVPQRRASKDGTLAGLVVACSPYSFLRLMRADIAGVAMMAFWPTSTCSRKSTCVSKQLLQCTR